MTQWDGHERREGLNLSNTDKDRLFRRIDDIYTIIMGDANPENGLVYKNQRNTEFRLWWEKFGWIVLAGFAGVPCTVVAGIVLHIAKGGN